MAVVTQQARAQPGTNEKFRGGRPPLAAGHHLSPSCHPGSGAGLCQQHGPHVSRAAGWEGSISGVSWASVRPGQSLGQACCGSAGSLALINLREACLLSP